jgi:hypothetical protein
LRDDIVVHYRADMTNPIRHLFTAHPRSIGESYAEHFLAALRFGLTMFAGGLACLVHALVPALFERTGSRAVKRLYSDMISRQPGMARPAYEDPSWRPEYEI